MWKSRDGKSSNTHPLVENKVSVRRYMVSKFVKINGWGEEGGVKIAKLKLMGSIW